MVIKVSKSTRAALFRDRLRHAMARRNISQSALARATGVDRSTLSQLLSDDGPRLPNAHIVGACASHLGVSADWFLGLSDRPESARDLLAGAMAMTDAPRALVDEQIFAWHKEAAGYKIRHVPATLPDILKTRDLLTWEFQPHLGRTAEQAINASEDRLTWMRGSPSDYEIAMPRHELTSLAEGNGYYQGLDKDLRLAQLHHMANLLEQFYPRMRLTLFDAQRVYSAPITVFGPLLAAVYIGQTYLTFRDTDRVQSFTRHFDNLVREAVVGERDSARFIRDQAFVPPA